MRTTKRVFFLAVFLTLCFFSVFAQYRAVHEIDSVMDLSPYYLPTYFTHTKFIEYEPLKYEPIDTGMTTTHLYDPFLRTENLYQNLGMVGHAHQSIIFDYQREMGFIYQMLPYPLNFRKQSDINYYKLQTTYANLAFTYGFPKELNLFAEFAKSIRGVTVSANMNASSIAGKIAEQNIRNLSGDIIIHYEIPSSIYGFRASYIINNLKHDEKGGMLDTVPYYGNNANTNFILWTPNAYSLITTHDFALQNYVNIKNKKDNYFGTFAYDFQLGQTNIEYKDILDRENPRYNTYNSDSATNDLTRVLNVKNSIQWSNFTPFQEINNKNYFFHIAGGLLYDYTQLKYTKNQFHSCYLFARTHIRLFKILDVNAQISYSFNGYTNNDAVSRLGISWAINREKEHIIGANANFYRNAPDYIIQHAASNHFQWDTLFPKQNVVQLKAYWNYKKYNASVSYYYLNKLVYLSEELRPMQNQNNGNMIQISTFIPFQYKNFGTTANLNLQYCTKDVVNVPLFAGKLSVFYIIELLKKRLKILVGTDLMYHTHYYADAYLPVLHQFYYQKSQQVGNFLFMDVNLTVKIERINFFFRAGNILAPVMKYRTYTTPNHPTAEYWLNLGITWKFYD